MKNFFRLFTVALAISVTVGLQPAQAGKPRPTPTSTLVTVKSLILYDAPPGTEYEKLGMGYAIMLKNLLSHFNSDAVLMPVHQYVAGRLNGYDATFYLGSYYDNQLPGALLSDIAASTKTVVWFRYNLWQFAWDAQYGFTPRYGFSFTDLRGMNEEPTSANEAPGFFDTVSYKNMAFVKYYAYDAANDQINADPDIGRVEITDPAKAVAVVNISNPKTGEVAPYILRSGKFWYVADIPFSYIGPRDRYLVIADILHDILGVDHPVNHRAMVRLEDVGALVSVQTMKTLSDYMYQKKIPFSIAVIPKYVDAFGVYNDNVPITIPLAEALNLKKALNYALRRGGELVMHGYTHQYGNIVNKNTGVSGDDFEFWNAADNTPVAEDSTAWALGRYSAGLNDLASNMFGTPVAWEAPHYQSSALAARATVQRFKTTYQRVVYYTADKPNFNASVSKDFSFGQVYPYVIEKDYYGQRVLPENLGNIEYDISEIDPTSNYNYTWQDLALNAQYALAVRDGFGSFFFHPFWLEPAIGKPGFEDFKKVIEALEGLGYTWTVPSLVKN